MVGSPVVAAWIAHLAFWTLLVWGWASGELHIRGISIVLALWIAAYLARGSVPYGPALFAPFVAALDVALVFAIFKGDVRIT